MNNAFQEYSNRIENTIINLYLIIMYIHTFTQHIHTLLYRHIPSGVFRKCCVHTYIILWSIFIITSHVYIHTYIYIHEKKYIHAACLHFCFVFILKARENYFSLSIFHTTQTTLHFHS